MILETTKYKYKYQIPFLDSFEFSWLISFYVFFTSLLYMAWNYDSSVKMNSIGGLQVFESSNVSYGLNILPGSADSNLFSLIYLDISSHNFDAKKENSFFSVEGEFLFNENNVRHHTNLINIRFQSELDTMIINRRLLSTGFFPFDSIIMQLHVFSQTNNITFHPTVRYIRGDPNFGRQCKDIRIVLSIISIACLVFYLFSVIHILIRDSHSIYDIKLEIVISFFAILISSLSNFPFSSVNIFKNENRLRNHCLNSFFKGLFSSIALSALSICIYKANHGQLVEFVFLMCILFSILASISEMTFDSRIVEFFFDVNTAIWHFFYSITAMAQISIYLSIFVNLYGLLAFSLANRRLYCGYLILTIISFATHVCKAVLFCMNGYINYSFDFFASYIVPTFITLNLVDMHWPQYDSQAVPFVELVESRKQIFSTL